MDSESLSFSEDLSSLPSSGDRLVRFGTDLPASQVLLEGPGLTSLGFRRDVVPLVRSTSLRVPSFQSAPLSTSVSSSGRSRPSSHSPSLASETLVSSPSFTTGGFSEEPSASSGSSSSAYLPLPTPSSSDLFVTTTAPHRAASRDTISRRLVECIKLSGEDSLLDGPVQTHDSRSLSTSWALLNGAPLEQILKAAFWCNSNTFIACFLRMSSLMKPFSRRPLWAFRARALRVPRRFPCTLKEDRVGNILKGR